MKDENVAAKKIYATKKEKKSLIANSYGDKFHVLFEQEMEKSKSGKGGGERSILASRLCCCILYMVWVIVSGQI